MALPQGLGKDTAEFGTLWPQAADGAVTRCIEAFAEQPKPLVAAVNGAAVGFGATGWQTGWRLRAVCMMEANITSELSGQVWSVGIVTVRPSATRLTAFCSKR